MNIAYVFPGQGSQKVGMGLDLYNETTIGKNLLNQVNEILGRDLSGIILNGPEEELNQTKNTQVAITSISIALISIFEDTLKKKNIKLIPSACCGHSLGELTALWYGGLISFEDLIRLVSVRGNLMQGAPSGTMAAILNLEAEKIESLINQDEYKGKIVIANYNSPTQVVISGNKEVFSSIPEKIKSLGGKSIILPVSGAFHSPLMNEPAQIFAKEIEKIDFAKICKLPIYQNCDAKDSKEKDIIIPKLKKQMTSPVYWTQTINNLVNSGVTRIIELGPGKVLTGLIKKINPNIICFNINDLSSINNFLEIYEQWQLQSETSKAT